MHLHLKSSLDVDPYLAVKLNLDLHVSQTVNPPEYAAEPDQKYKLHPSLQPQTDVNPNLSVI